MQGDPSPRLGPDARDLGVASGVRLLTCPAARPVRFRGSAPCLPNRGSPGVPARHALFIAAERGQTGRAPAVRPN